MRSKLKQPFIAYLLSVTLLLTIAMIFETGNNNHTDASPNLSIEADSKVHIADFIKLPLFQPFIKNSFIIPSNSTTREVKIIDSAAEKSFARPISKPDDNKEIAAAPLKPTSTVKSDSGLNEAQIEEIFKGTSLAGYGLEKAVMEVEEEDGVNAFFTIAVMKLESANGKSKIAMDKNNMFGLNAIDGDEYNMALSFNTKGDSVRKFGQLLSINYVDKGFTTVEKVADKYCEANPEWPSLVKRIMEGDYRKLL
jgi:hypothetical protein